jgi:hypothetical protein
MMSVSIPPSSGGCGNTHSRPVRHGAPDKTFQLDCLPCEAYLKGAGKPQVLRYDLDPATHVVLNQQRVADADPHWASSPYAIPETPDEKKSHKRQIETGKEQLAMIQALTAAKASGIEIPEAAMFALQHALPSSFLQGHTICPNGHDNTPGARFCSECAVRMDSQTAIAETPALPAEIPLDRLHVATLRKKLRAAGLSDKGSKDEMVQRLEAAA